MLFTIKILYIFIKQFIFFQLKAHRKTHFLSENGFQLNCKFCNKVFIKVIIYIFDSDFVWRVHLMVIKG